MPEAELMPPVNKTGGKPRVGDGTAGPGRPRGMPNKLTTTVKEAIAQAFDEVGGVDYLKNVAMTDPAVFCTLLGKLLPMQLANAEGDELIIKIEYESKMSDGNG